MNCLPAMYKHVCIVLCTTLFALVNIPIYAQWYKEKPSLTGSFEKRNSFVEGATADLNGIKAGLDFDHTVKFTIARYKLVADIVEQKTITLDNGNDTSLRANLQMLYYAPGIEYIFYKSDMWQLSAPIEFGIGNSYFEYFEQRTVRRKAFVQSIVLIEPGIAGHVKLIKWAGIGFGSGYRIMLKNNTQLKTNMSNFTFSIGVKFFFSEIINSIFGNEIKITK